MPTTHGARILIPMVLLLSACSSNPPPPPPKPAPKPAPPMASAPEPPLPAYLAKFPGLYVRKGDAIVDAPQDDVDVAKSYARSNIRGPLVDDRRITLLTKKLKVKVGEEVRVIHVVEVPTEGQELYVMGPKPVRGEHVDGKLASPIVLTTGDPFVPDIYDGVVLPSPAVDYNYDITSYRFSAPGRHTIQWKIGKWASNVLVIEVS